MAKAQKIADSPAGTLALDEKDFAILRLLQDNARMTVKEIAEHIHLTTTPVHERIRRMENDGVIRQYVALLNYSKVKKGLMVICYVSLRQHSKLAGSTFIDAIHALPEVIECYSISGEFDFLLKVVEESMDSYYDFHVNKLSQIENVGQVQSVFVMGIVKESYRLL